ncbi:MAG TPA: capsular biosynthesis protein, partial [Ramlibacter sp.]|nr:capsular biosynthesis protein [Ramlibacter sp.]
MIVIPMAGNSSRFYQAGFTRPKYELPVGKDTLFARCVGSFEAYFASESFLFVCRPGVDAERFVHAECAKLGLAR